MTMSSFFSQFDLFGVKPLLYFKGKLKFGTIFGFILTLFLASFSIICLFFFGQNLYNKKNPISSSHEEYIHLPESFTIDPESFPFAIEINSPTGNVFYTDSTLVQVNVTSFSLEKTSYPPKIDVSTYRMEICNKTHFQKLSQFSQRYFENLNITNYYCIPRNVINLTLEGAYDQNLFKLVKFSFSICNNATNPEKNCQPLDEIKKKMARGFVGIHFVDFAMNIGSYENFYKEQPKEVFTNWGLNNQKEIDLLFKNNYLETENGIVFDDSVTNRIVNYDFSRELTFDYASDNFLTINLKLNQRKINWIRSYQKLQDLLAQIGGFINAFWIILYCLNLIHGKIVFIKDIIFDIFIIKSVKKQDFVGSSNLLPERRSETIEIKHDFSPINNQKTPDKKSTFHKYTVKDQELMTIEDKNTHPPQFNNVINSGNLTPKIIDRNEKEIDFEGSHFSKEMIRDKDLPLDSPNRLLTESPPIIPPLKNLESEIPPLKNLESEGQEISFFKFGFIDYIHYYTGFFNNPEREKRKFILKKGEKILCKTLDVKFMIQKFYEIEKLKRLLLNENQLKIFNSLSKPEISIISSNGFKRSTMNAITTVLSRRLTDENLNKNYVNVTDDKKINSDRVLQIDRHTIDINISQKMI